MAILTSNTNQVQALYLIVYGRAADPAGLAYWVGQADNRSIDEVVDEFLYSHEFNDRFGDLKPGHFINQMYEFAFNRPPTYTEFLVAAIQYWDNDQSLAVVVAKTLEAAVERDDAVLSARVEVANAVTDKIAELQKDNPVFYNINNGPGDDSDEMLAYFADIGADNTADLDPDAIHALMVDMGYDSPPPPNEAPETDAVTASGASNALIAITLSGTDSDGSVSHFALTGLPLNGVLYTDAEGTIPLTVENSLSVAADGTGVATLYFAPNTVFFGQVEFEYAAVDDDGATDETPGIVAITVTEAVIPNEAPETDAVTASGSNDDLIAILLSGTDSDGTVSHFKLGGPPLNGKLYTDAAGTIGITAADLVAYQADDLGQATLYFRPTGDFVGIATFGYFAVDDDGARGAGARVTITVSDGVIPNEAPQTDAVTASGGNNTLIAITLSGTDSDGVVSHFTLKSMPLNGLLYTDAAGTIGVKIEDLIAYPADDKGTATFYFQPADNFIGKARFEYVAVDNEGAADETPGIATITVTDAVIPNQAPVTGEVFTMGVNHTRIAIILSGTDDDEVAGFQLTSLPLNGTLYAKAYGDDKITAYQTLFLDPDATGTRTIYFEPFPNFTGDIEFEYIAGDNMGLVDETPAHVLVSVMSLGTPTISLAPSTDTGTIGDGITSHAIPQLLIDLKLDDKHYGVGVGDSLVIGIISWDNEMSLFRVPITALNLTDGVVTVDLDSTLYPELADLYDDQFGSNQPYQIFAAVETAIGGSRLSDAFDLGWDQKAPAITGFEITQAEGFYTAGDIIHITASVDDRVMVGGTVWITLNNGVLVQLTAVEIAPDDDQYDQDYGRLEGTYTVQEAHYQSIPLAVDSWEGLAVFDLAGNTLLDDDAYGLDREPWTNLEGNHFAWDNTGVFDTHNTYSDIYYDWDSTTNTLKAKAVGATTMASVEIYSGDTLIATGSTDGNFGEIELDLRLAYAGNDTENFEKSPGFDAADAADDGDKYHAYVTKAEYRFVFTDSNGTVFEESYYIILNKGLNLYEKVEEGVDIGVAITSEDRREMILQAVRDADATAGSTEDNRDIWLAPNDPNKTDGGDRVFAESVKDWAGKDQWVTAAWDVYYAGNPAHPWTALSLNTNTFANMRVEMTFPDKDYRESQVNFYDSDNVHQGSLTVRDTFNIALGSKAIGVSLLIGNELDNQIESYSGAYVGLGLEGDDIFRGGAMNPAPGFPLSGMSWLDGGLGFNTLNMRYESAIHDPINQIERFYHIVLDMSTTTTETVKIGEQDFILLDAYQVKTLANTDNALNSSDYFINIQEVIGTSHDDILKGNEETNWLHGGALQGNDVLWGRGGDDHLVGGGGDDALEGGDGDDILYGDEDARAEPGSSLKEHVTVKAHLKGLMVEGNDVLNGGIGNDTLVGGGGDDVMTGGEGADRFILYAADNGTDSITDFENTLDQLWIDITGSQLSETNSGADIIYALPFWDGTTVTTFNNGTDGQGNPITVSVPVLGAYSDVDTFRQAVVDLSTDEADPFTVWGLTGSGITWALVQVVVDQTVDFTDITLDEVGSGQTLVNITGADLSAGQDLFLT